MGLRADERRPMPGQARRHERLKGGLAPAGIVEQGCDGSGHGLFLVPSSDARAENRPFPLPL
jgi:hypothetical protein